LPRRAPNEPEPFDPADHIDPPIYPTRDVNRFLSPPCAEKLVRIIEGSPKLSPGAVVQSAIARGEWNECLIEDVSGSKTVEIIVNPNYRPPKHTVKVMCKWCVWRNLCSVHPGHIDCDYETED
jgi:hypothetical protein